MNNGLLVKVTSGLLIIGISASVAFSYSANARMAVLDNEIRELKGMEATVRDLELLLLTVNDNHKIIKAEAVDMRVRIREIEKRVWGTG